MHGRSGPWSLVRFVSGPKRELTTNLGPRTEDQPLYGRKRRHGASLAVTRERLPGSIGTEDEKVWKPDSCTRIRCVPTDTLETSSVVVPTSSSFTNSCAPGGSEETKSEPGAFGSRAGAAAALLRCAR